MGNVCNTTKLEKIQVNDVDFFSFKNKTLKCKVCNVYDGDTIYVIIEVIEDKFFKFKVRLNGFDSCEMKPLKSIQNRSEHIECAKKLKQLLSDLILYKIVEIKCDEYDKYGRILGNVYYKDVCINKLLIDLKLVKPYSGNKKSEFTEEDLKHILEFNINQFKVDNFKLFE